MVEEQPTSFSLFLLPGDEGEGAFKTIGGTDITDHTPEQFLRDSCNGEITCTLLRLVHGRLFPDSKKLATLIQLQLRFFPRKEGYRIRSAEVNFTFRGQGTTLRVAKIAPDGWFSLAHEISEQEVMYKLGLNVGATLPALPVSFNLLADRQVLVKGHRTTASRVLGNRLAAEENNSNETVNEAYWSLHENPSSKGGVPGEVKVAMLVERDTMATFWCDVRAESDRGLFAGLQSLFSLTPRVKSVPFHPAGKPFPENDQDDKELDQNSLGRVRLDSLAAILLEKRILGEVTVVGLGNDTARNGME